MPEPDLIELFVRPLNQLGVRYLVSGSVASMLYGEPRVTHDTDFVVFLRASEIAGFPRVYPPPEFYLPPAEVIAAEVAREGHGHFNIIHADSGLKADFFPAKRDELHAWAFRRANQYSIRGITVSLSRSAKREPEKPARGYAHPTNSCSLNRRKPLTSERFRVTHVLMCGRYSLGKKPRAWPDDADEFQPRYNIAPSQDAPVFLNDGSLVVRKMRWGLIPSWADDEKTGYKMINAKAETLIEKPAFRRCLESRRCVAPADGFYEWRKASGAKIPLWFFLRNDEPFGFAGLWDRWRPPGQNAIESFTIITTDANDVVRPIHDRMPAMLDSKAMMEWLDPEREFGTLEALLQPFPGPLMGHHAVSSKVNGALVDDPSCIEPVADLQSMLPGI